MMRVKYKSGGMNAYKKIPAQSSEIVLKVEETKVF